MPNHQKTDGETSDQQQQVKLESHSCDSSESNYSDSDDDDEGCKTVQSRRSKTVGCVDPRKNVDNIDTSKPNLTLLLKIQVFVNHQHLGLLQVRQLGMKLSLLQKGIFSFLYQDWIQMFDR